MQHPTLLPQGRDTSHLFSEHFKQVQQLPAWVPHISKHDGSDAPIIPLRAKRVGEFIKNGHKKISPTRLGSGSGVTL